MHMQRWIDGYGCDIYLSLCTYILHAADWINVGQSYQDVEGAMMMPPPLLGSVRM